MTDTRGPCSPWDAIWCCSLTADSPMPTGTAVEIATEILYNLSGQIFGVCEFTVRPCRQSCNDDAWWSGAGYLGWGGWLGGMYPQPALIGGNWYNLRCGGCAGSCSCSPLSVAVLPSPVSSITQVKLDGVVLTPGVDYRVDNFRELVRLGGNFWPECQDMAAADTEPDTWSVTLNVGEAVPALGQLAVGELACQLRTACAGGDCQIPAYATTITRQGITIDQPALAEFLSQGLLGLRWVDTFVNTYNPQRLKAPPMVYDVDGESFRRVNT